MRIIDYRLPDTADPFAYFKAVWIAITHEGYKPWYEGPYQDSIAEGLEPIIEDLRPEAQWRGVHGYLSFGLYGNARWSSPHGRMGAIRKVEWYPAQFINWKENWFDAPRDGFNAVRIWLRHDVRAIVQYWSEEDPRQGSAEIVHPTTYEKMAPPIPFSSHLAPE